jgi:signal transduction histidine kinase/DNA-binding response OmpR family regulator
VATAVKPLRGRETEQRTLELALADPAVRGVVARGPAGVGKTAFLKQALTRLGNEGALTGSGKHVDGGGDDLGPLMTALGEAAAAGLDQLYDPEGGLASLAAALGPHASAFADVDHGLLRGLAPRTGAPPLETAEERLPQAVLALLRWMEGFSQPIVLLIDDWGRAGLPARRLYQRLLAERELPSLRLFATERDEESAGIDDSVDVRVVAMSLLDRSAMRAVVRDVLGPEGGAAARQLMELLPAQTAPFDLLQALQVLIGAGALQAQGAHWRFDAPRAVAALGDTLTAAIGGRISSMGADELQLAQAMAVLGAEIRSADLIAACALAARRGTAAIANLERDGMIRRHGETVLLAHDRIREAILASLDQERQRHLAGEIAEDLRARGAAPGDGGAGRSLLGLRLKGGLPVKAAADWAPLFAQGARMARAAGDHNTASNFAEAAIALAEQAGLDSIPILTEGALAAAQRREISRARDRADRLALIAPDDRAREEADEVRILVARMAHDNDRALAVGLEAAARAGIVLPARPSLARVVIELLRIRLADPARAMTAGPLDDDTLTLVAPRLRMLMATGSLLHESNLRQALIFAARTASGRFGSGTAIGASVRAWACCEMGDYARAARWSEVSDARLSPAQPSRAAAILTTTAFGHWFTRPRAELTGRYAEVEALAYAEGDLSTAAYAHRNRLLDLLFLGTPLPDVARAADLALGRLNDLSTQPVIAAVRQIAHNLITGGAQPWVLGGAHFDPIRVGGGADASRLRIGNVHRPLAMLEAFLALLHGRLAECVAVHERRLWTFRGAAHNPQMAIWAFATGLSLYRVGRRPPGSYLRILRRLADANPCDHRHRWLSLEAERARARGRGADVLALYEEATTAARASGNLLELGVVARAACDAAEALGAHAAAAGFRACSLAAWRGLGAAALLGRSDASSGERAASAGPEMSQAARARELELAAARDAAERANRAKSRLLAAVGHELRTPLQGISGLLELAGSGAALEIDVLRSAVAQLSTVVGDLTDLGALDASALSLSRSVFDPHALAAGVIAVHAPSLAGAGRKVSLITAGKRMQLVGDEARIRQILSNLIGNAVSHGGGDIVVKLDLTPADAAAAHLTVEVSDQGEGLSPADLVRLFEPFERGEAADRIAGLGLGLSISRRLATAMAGELTAHSAPDEGAHFRLVLNLPQAPREPVRAERGDRARRVLLAEDTPLSRRVLSALLTAQGCVVREARDGEDALALARVEPFDLLMLDMRMPGATGVDVARMIRSEPSVNGATPITVITASRDSALDEAAAELGLECVLQKPVDGDLLRRLLLALATGDWPNSASTQTNSVARRLTELSEALGAEEAAALLEQVEPSVRGALDEALRAIHAGADEEAARELHRMAGLLAHFGLEREAAVSRQAERTLLRDGSHGQAALAETLARTVDAIDWKELRSSGAPQLWPQP